MFKAEVKYFIKNKFKKKNLSNLTWQLQFRWLDDLLCVHLRLQIFQRCCRFLMMRIYLQTIKVRLLGVFELAVFFIIASECQQSFAQIFLGIGVRAVQLQCGFEVHDGFGKRAAVCIERPSSDQPFDISGVDR